MTERLGNAVTELRSWPLSRWACVVLATAGVVVLFGVPTALIETPFFSREIPPTPWAWPVLLLSATATGILLASYVRLGMDVSTPRAERRGGLGSLLAFLAVGCPVCNKLVLVLLGTSGALQYFEPIQPLLAVVGLVVLLWALVLRLDALRVCRTRLPEPIGASSSDSP